MDASGPPPVKKRKRVLSDFKPTKKEAVTRPDGFVSAMKDMYEGNRDHVALSTTIPFEHKHYSKSTKSDFVINPDYSLEPHPSVQSEKVVTWEQGWMHGYQQTNWLDKPGKKGKAMVPGMLPEHLTREMAQNTTRAIKHSVGTGSSNVIGFTDLDNKSDSEGKAKKAVLPAIMSFTEDITGLKAVGVSDTGSAIRASYLDAHLKMKMDPSVKRVKNFQSTVANQLTQIKPGGAAELNKKIAEKTPNVRENYADVVGSIHQDLKKTIKDRFEQKWSQVEKGDAMKSKGKWWGTKNVNDFSDGQRTQTFKEYKEHKYQKYAIGKFGIRPSEK
ncbi:MAG TPA: hypothetical protein VLC08_03565 [Chitinolyticbacter sp.]|nr:hypothetical protein [Chitinolyticbacter sp.]